MTATTLQAFVNERESVFLLFVFSSVVFVFLTGASWPRYLMSRLWYVVGDCVPGTWMSNGYVLMQTNGATLYQVQHHYWMLWLQVPVMFTLAYLVERYLLGVHIHSRTLLLSCRHDCRGGLHLVAGEQ